MKISNLLILLLAGSYLFAQKTEAYYDHAWQPCSPEIARYFSTNEKTDSGWLRNDYFISTMKLQMRALFEDEASKRQNGYLAYYHANGLLSVLGRTIHGRQEGICVRYHANGMLADSAEFHNGQVVDKRFRWYPNGFPADSISRVNDSLYTQVGWFDDGQPAYAGYLLYGKQEAKWKYYHPNGQLSSVEIYSHGNLKSATYYDDKGTIQQDTSAVNREAQFKGGEGAWKKYLEKKLYWPTDLAFKTAGSVTLIVDFTVDEDGHVVDAFVSLPFYEQFDRIALAIVKNSPPWIPAMAHNRKVKGYRRQPVTFEQPD